MYKIKRIQIIGFVLLKKDIKSGRFAADTGAWRLMVLGQASPFMAGNQAVTFQCFPSLSPCCSMFSGQDGFMRMLYSVLYIVQ